MIKLKREYFRNSIQRQAREEIFKKKRIFTNNYNPTNLNNPFHEQLNELFESNLSMQEIHFQLQQLYKEYNLFPERNIQILSQIKILSMKVAQTKNQQNINDFYFSIHNNILNEILKFCSQEYADDANKVELTNNCLWILINLTLADDCVSYLMENTNLQQNLNLLIKSKYEAIVHRSFELIYNIIVEEEACYKIIQDPQFEESFLYRLKRQNPEIIMNAAASIIKNFCNNFRNEYLPKILQFMFYCIRIDSINGLISIIPEEMCAQFLKDYRGFCMKLFSNPCQSINFINYLSTNQSNEVFDLLLEYPLIDELVQIKNSNHQIKVFTTFSNLATYEPFHNQLRILFANIFDQYEKSDLKMKVEIGYFVSMYIQHCDPTFYGDLIENGIIELFVEFFKEIYDPQAIEQGLYALQNLFLNENAKTKFQKLGGFYQLEKLKQNNNIIQLAQRIS